MSEAEVLSPEKSFEEAVAEKAAMMAGAMFESMKAQIVSEIIKQREGVAPASSTSTDNAFAAALAMQLAELNDQGSGRKRVAPEVMRARADAREKMSKLIAKAYAEDAIPTYKLRNKVYLDEVLVDPIYIAPDHTQRATEIEWRKVPNEAMIPTNDVARDIFEAFIASIGSVAKADQVPDRPLKVTAGGLVIKGRPSPARPNNAEGPGETAGGLRITHRGQGAFVEKSILGTIAQPARQMV